MGSNIQEKVLQVTEALEKQVDAVIENFNNLDACDLDDLRKQRKNELRKLEEKHREWLQNDHGKYEELPEEKCFFDIIKKSENIILHFYRDSTPRCAIVDKHLKILAPKHIETRFTKVNAEKCPFLCERLKIRTIPTIVLIQNTVMIDKIVGFTDLGNRDDFTTEIIEWRLAQNGILNYDGDLTTPPDQQVAKSKGYGKKIRDSAFNKDDDDLDIEEYGLNRESNLPQVQTKSDALSTELTAEEAAELGLDDD